MEQGRDERYMRLALRLALKGAGRTSPNPMVGAVLVRGGRILATGFHRRAGADHAEIIALKRAGEKARGATLYLNLEPCSHYGRTPPCTRSLVESGVHRVVAGMVDPNPRVSGRGIRVLRSAGIGVEVGILEEACRKLNEAFIKYITRRTPFVTLKSAASLDGRIATFTGDSHWITGAVGRRIVHHLRNQVDAVLVGIGTVLADNPRLTCRIPGGRDPLRIVLDSRLRIPLNSRLLNERGPEKTVVVTGRSAPAKKAERIRALGAQVWPVRLRAGKVPLAPLLKKLGAMGVVSMMIEGGASVAASALQENVVDKMVFFYAPKLIGGDGKGMIGTLGVRTVKQARKAKRVELKRVGEDFLVSMYL